MSFANIFNSTNHKVGCNIEYYEMVDILNDPFLPPYPQVISDHIPYKEFFLNQIDYYTTKTINFRIKGVVTGGHFKIFPSSPDYY